jgi:hypothetical protein
MRAKRLEGYATSVVDGCWITWLPGYGLHQQDAAVNGKANIDLDQHPLPPPAIEFAVKDPFPRAKIELAVGHRNHHFAAHHLPLQVRIGIVFTGTVVANTGRSAHAAPVLRATPRSRGASHSRRH